MIKLFFIKLKSLWNKIKRTDLYVKKYQKTVLTTVMPEYAYINWGKYLAMQGNLKGAMEKFEVSASMARQIPETYINLGLVYANLKQFSKAAKNFKKAIKLDKNSAKAYSLLASVLVEEDEVEEAQYLYKKANKLDPRDSEIYLNWAVSLLKLKKTNEAMDKFRLAVLYNPSNFMASHMWGVALYENKMYEEAIDKFEYTLSYVPNDAASLYFLSKSMLELGIYNEALEPARKSVMLNPYNVDGYVLLSDLYMKTNNEQKCLKAFDDARKFGLKSIKLDYEEAYANEFFKNYDRAKEGFRTVYAGDNKRCEALYHLAICEMASGNKEEGKELLLRVLENKPNHPEALYQLGLYNYQTRNFEKALEYFNKIIEINPKSLKNIYFNSANCYAALKDYETAIKLYNKNIEYYPQDWYAYVNLASVYIEMEDYTSAHRAIRAAYKLDKENYLTIYLYGMVYFGLKLYKEAIEKFDYLLSKNKDDRTVFFNRLECLICLNRIQEVLGVLENMDDKESDMVMLLYVKAYTRLACIEPSYYNIEVARKHIAKYKEKYPDSDSYEEDQQKLAELETKTGE